MPYRSIDKYIARKYGSLREQYARTVAEVIAEYARTAPANASTEKVIAAMLADYPTIRRRQVTYSLTEWTKNPGRYPALNKEPRFFDGGKLVIKGLGDKVAKRDLRFVGGWDLERALLKPAQTNRRLAVELGVRSQYTAISLRLPMLDRMVAELKGQTPLAHHHVLWVTHLLGTMVPLADALRQAGMSASDSIIVGTGYGTNRAVFRTLRADGHDVRRARLGPGERARAVEAAVDEMMKRVMSTGKSVVVLDDGGTVAETLHTKYADAKYAKWVRKFKIVEQTTIGITRAQRFQLQTPVVAAALARSKRFGESVFIGRAVAAKVEQGLRRLGMSLPGKVVVVNGFGAIGEATARAARASGARVIVIESKDKEYQRALAAKDGRGKPLFEVLRLTETAARTKALSQAHVVLGCTGARSLTFEDFKVMRAGVIVASTSSADVETARHQVVAKATSQRKIDPGNPLVRLPTRAYTLDGKEIIFMGDGWPVNFDGDVEDIPAEQIQITRAIMFAGAIQAAGLNANDAANRRVIRFRVHDDRIIFKEFRRIERETRDLAIGDPDRWPDRVRDIARFLGTTPDTGGRGRRSSQQ